MAHVFNPARAKRLLSKDRMARQPLEPILSRLKPEAGQTWLDLGAGSGFMTLPLLEQGCHVIALDLSEEMLDYLLSRVPEDLLPHLELGVAAAPPLPLEDASVDNVVLINVFHEIPDHSGAAREMLRVLRPGGRIHILDHRRDSDQGGSPKKDRLDPAEVEEAFGREALETYMEPSYYHLVF